MTYKYRYTGKAVMSFWADGVNHVVGGHNNPMIGNVVELQEKVDILGLELIEEKKVEKKYSKRKTKQEDDI